MKIPKIIRTSKKKKADSALEREARNIVYIIYKLLNFALPIVLLILIREGLSELAVVLALFSKWRIFSVKPRHMLANIRSNATDVIVKLSTLAFMIQAEALTEQLLWTAWYILWLTVIKPASKKTMITVQAIAGQTLGLTALFLSSNNINDLLLLGAVWVVSLASARHFFSSYEETRINLLSNLWALFVLELAWVLNQWLLVYVFVPQLLFIVIIVGYALGSIYDAQKQEQLKKSFVRQQLVMASIILIVVAALADWQGVI